MAQRILAAKDERHGSSRYALVPDRALRATAVAMDPRRVRRADPLSGPRQSRRSATFASWSTLLPSPLKGLLLATFAAAYMSTIGTHLNWGASYLVNDVYLRFIKPDASRRPR